MREFFNTVEACSPHWCSLNTLVHQPGCSSNSLVHLGKQTSVCVFSGKFTQTTLNGPYFGTHSFLKTSSYSCLLGSHTCSWVSFSLLHRACGNHQFWINSTLNVLETFRYVGCKIHLCEGDELIHSHFQLLTKIIYLNSSSANLILKSLLEHAFLFNVLTSKI